MTLTEITYAGIFILLEMLVVVSAYTVATAKNILRAAFALLATFLGVAGFYVYLRADFLAAVQLLVYVGGILVLIIFAVMLTHKISDVRLTALSAPSSIAAIISVCVFAILLLAIRTLRWQNILPLEGEESTTQYLGEAFVGEYLLPFEVASVILLVGLLGAAYLARKASPLENNNVGKSRE